MKKNNNSKTVKKQQKKVQPQGVAYINSTYNNTLITITDNEGNVICWTSAGSKFRGSKKATPFAAATVSEDVAKQAYSYGLREIDVVMKGAGNAKTHSVKSLRNGGLVIKSIFDKTPIKHGGVKPKKRRRL